MWRILAPKEPTCKLRDRTPHCQTACVGWKKRGALYAENGEEVVIWKQTVSYPSENQNLLCCGALQCVTFTCGRLQVNQLLELSGSTKEDDKYKALQSWSNNLRALHSGIVNKLSY